MVANKFEIFSFLLCFGCFVSLFYYRFSNGNGLVTDNDTSEAQQRTIERKESLKLPLSRLPEDQLFLDSGPGGFFVDIPNVPNSVSNLFDHWASTVFKSTFSLKVSQYRHINGPLFYRAEFTGEGDQRVSQWWRYLDMIGRAAQPLDEDKIIIANKIVDFNEFAFSQFYNFMTRRFTENDMISLNIAKSINSSI